MPKTLKLCDLIKSLWGGYSDDVGKALIHLGATGWFFSALAQIGMISTNEHIDKKEKRFLIPQEISDGIINVTLYYTICQGIKHVGEYVLDNGKLLTNQIADTLKRINPYVNKNYTQTINQLSEAYKQTNLMHHKSNNSVTTVLKGTINYLKGKNITAIEKFEKLYPDIVQNIKENFTKSESVKNIEMLKDNLKNFNKFKNGIGVLMAVGGSILACNMITPVCRNISANYFQKKLMNHKKRTIAKPKNINTYKTQLPTPFDNFKI